MNRNRKTIENILSVVLYVVAGLLTIFTIWVFYYCADEISQVREAGQLPDSGVLYIIVRFYMSNCAQYFAFALLLAAAGLLLQRRQPELSKPADTASQVQGIDVIDDDADDNDEPSEWYSEEIELETEPEEDDAAEELDNRTEN